MPHCPIAASPGTPFSMIFADMLTCGRARVEHQDLSHRVADADLAAMSWTHGITAKLKAIQLKSSTLHMRRFWPVEILSQRKEECTSGHP